MILSWKLFEAHRDIITDCEDILNELNYDYQNFKTEVKIVNANSTSGIEMWKTMYWKNKGITNDFLSVSIEKIEQISDNTYSQRRFEWGEIKETVFRIADYVGVDYSDIFVSFVPIGSYGNITLDELENTPASLYRLLDEMMIGKFSMEIKLPSL